MSDQVDDVIDDDGLVDYEKLDEVIGTSPVNRCTYDDGYMKRQGLFSCVQCLNESGLTGVLCYGCVVICHEGHEPIVEMWTKRNYRCDCGNSRYREGFECCLRPGKDSINVKNDYDNHNLRGLYCVCDGEYKIGEQEMWMCVICEDWFHLDHGDLEEFPREVGGGTENVCLNCCRLHADFLVRFFAKRHDPSDVAVICLADDVVGGVGDRALIDELRSNRSRVFSSEWRRRICKCEECQDRLESMGLRFLADEEDTLDRFLSNNTDDDAAAADADDATIRIAHTNISSVIGRTISDVLEKLLSSGRVRYSDNLTEADASNVIDECRVDLTEFITQTLANSGDLSVEEIRNIIFDWFRRRRQSDELRRHERL